LDDSEPRLEYNVPNDEVRLPRKFCPPGLM
jgi:hypothetical protein